MDELAELQFDLDFAVFRTKFYENMIEEIEKKQEELQRETGS